MALRQRRRQRPSSMIASSSSAISKQIAAESAVDDSGFSRSEKDDQTVSDMRARMAKHTSSRSLKYRKGAAVVYKKKDEKEQNEEKIVEKKESPKKRVCAPPPVDLTDENTLARMRRNAALEVLTSEESYLNSLQLARTVYVRPIEATFNSKQPLLTQQELSQITGNLDVLINYSQALYGELKNVVMPGETEEGGQTMKLSAVFMLFAKFLQVYKDYTTQYNEAIELLSNVSETRPHLRNFLTETRDGPQSKHLSFQDYLIMPVQRVPRYVLLLREVCKYTAPSHEDYEPLQKAFAQVQKLAQELNESKRRAEKQAFIMKLQSRMGVSTMCIVAPHRYFIKEGPIWFLDIETRKCELIIGILFNDLILFALSGSQDSLKFQRGYPLASAEIKPLPWLNQSVTSSSQSSSSKKQFRRSLSLKGQLTLTKTDITKQTRQYDPEKDTGFQIQFPFEKGLYFVFQDEQSSNEWRDGLQESLKFCSEKRNRALVNEIVYSIGCFEDELTNLASRFQHPIYGVKLKAEKDKYRYFSGTEAVKWMIHQGVHTAAGVEKLDQMMAKGIFVPSSASKFSSGDKFKNKRVDYKLATMCLEHQKQVLVDFLNKKDQTLEFCCVVFHESNTVHHARKLVEDIEKEYKKRVVTQFHTIDNPEKYKDWLTIKRVTWSYNFLASQYHLADHVIWIVAGGEEWYIGQYLDTLILLKDASFEVSSLNSLLKDALAHAKKDAKNLYSFKAEVLETYSKQARTSEKSNSRASPHPGSSSPYPRSSSPLSSTITTSPSSSSPSSHISDSLLLSTTGSPSASPLPSSTSSLPPLPSPSPHQSNSFPRPSHKSFSLSPLPSSLPSPSFLPPSSPTSSSTNISQPPSVPAPLVSHLPPVLVSNSFPDSGDKKSRRQTVHLLNPQGSNSEPFLNRSSIKKRSSGVFRVDLKDQPPPPLSLQPIPSKTLPQQENESSSQTLGSLPPSLSQSNLTESATTLPAFASLPKSFSKSSSSISDSPPAPITRNLSSRAIKSTPPVSSQPPLPNLSQQQLPPPQSSPRSPPSLSSALPPSLSNRPTEPKQYPQSSSRTPPSLPTALPQQPPSRMPSLPSTLPSQSSSRSPPEPTQPPLPNLSQPELQQLPPPQSPSRTPPSLPTAPPQQPSRMPSLPSTLPSQSSSRSPPEPTQPPLPNLSQPELQQLPPPQSSSRTPPSLPNAPPQQSSRMPSLPATFPSQSSSRSPPGPSMFPPSLSQSDLANPQLPSSTPPPPIPSTQQLPPMTPTQPPLPMMPTQPPPPMTPTQPPPPMIPTQQPPPMIPTQPPPMTPTQPPPLMTPTQPPPPMTPTQQPPPMTPAQPPPPMTPTQPPPPNLLHSNSQDSVPPPISSLPSNLTSTLSSSNSLPSPLPTPSLPARLPSLPAPLE